MTTTKQPFKKGDRVQVRLWKYSIAYGLSLFATYTVSGVYGNKKSTQGQYITLEKKGEKRMYAPYFDLKP